MSLKLRIKGVVEFIRSLTQQDDILVELKIEFGAKDFEFLHQ